MALTPNMNLLLPDVGTTLGPTWASELNAALGLVDSHDHVVGQGVPVPTAGLNINADLSFNNFNATSLRSSRMTSQGSPLAGVTDLTCLYVSSGNLYYNNSVGNQIRITVGAGLDASSVGGFGGDYGTSTASAFYTSATSTFTFWQDVDQMAIMQVGPLQLANTDQDTNFITVQAPVGLSSSYQLTLPTGLPASRKIMTVDASGNVGDVLDVDNSTLAVSGNNLIVKTSGITDTQIATSTITVDKMATMPVSTSAAVSNGLLSTASSGNFITSSTTPVTVTNLSGTIDTNGRPIYIQTTCDPGAINSYFRAGGTGTVQIFISIYFDGGSIFEGVVQSSTPDLFIPPVISSIVSAIAGTHTIEIKARATAGSTAYVISTILVAYEI